MGDAPSRGRLQRVPQRAVAQHRLGAEQALDRGERTGDVAVVEAFADAGEAVGAAVRLVDGPQTGQRRTAEGGEQFLPPDLVRVVVEGGQCAVFVVRRRRATGA